MSTRREVLRRAPAIIGVAAMPFAQWREAQAQTTTRTRRNVTSASTDLETYRRGITAMRALSTSDPRRWENFASIHGNRCQHAHWWFQPWHRIYILRLEAIVTQLTNTPGFALPYWNQYTQRSLPLPFRSPTTNNPLYVSQRSSAANGGSQMSLSTADPRPALAEATFAGFAGPAVSSPTTRGPAYGRVEVTPHNAVHNWVGGSRGLMSSLSGAPRDPIFWLHHCNIDRLWEVWLRQGGGRSNPASSTWLNQTFSFPDATGPTITTRVGDVLNTGNLGYFYDDTSVPGSTTAALAPGMVTLAASTDTSIETVDATAQGEARNVALSKRPKKIRLPAVAGRVVVENLSGQTQGAILAVYANLPLGVEPHTPASQPYFIGNIAPFGAGEHGAGGHGNSRFEFEVPSRLVGAASELVLTIAADPTSETSNVNVGLLKLQRG